MADPHYNSRLIGIAADGIDVYANECHECGTADRDISRLINIVRQNPVPAGEEPWIPVLGQIIPCQKDWEGEEDYTDYDFGGSAHVRSISTEMTIVLTGMNDCTTNGDTCVKELLTYSVTNGSWIGSATLSGGTVNFEVYGTWDGLSEHWWLTLTGCPTNGTQELTVPCEDPLFMVGTGGGGPFGLDCCGAIPEPAPIYIWAKIPPIYVARLSGMDGPDPVYVAAECCPEVCPFNPGCCDGIPIDDQIDFTIFNIVENNPACTRSCGPGFSISATTSDGCATFSVDNCSGPHTVCLSCSLSSSEEDRTRGWQHYRISLLGNDYPPVDGGCDPFFVTFEDIPWTSPDPSGTCSGTLSITVTR